MKITVDLNLADVLHAAVQKALNDLGIKEGGIAKLASVTIKDPDVPKRKDSTILSVELDIEKANRGEYHA